MEIASYISKLIVQTHQINYLFGNYTFPDSCFFLYLVNDWVMDIEVYNKLQ